MKKILWVLFIAVIAAGLGFAQELKFGGYMNYGLGLEYSNEGGPSDPTVRAAGVDSEQTGGRFRLNGSYTNADKTVGADLRIQLQGANGGTNSLSSLTYDTSTPPVATGSNSGNPVGGDNTYDLGLAYAYGWVRPVDILLIKAGIVSDSTFETAGAILRDDASSGAGAGLFVKLTPIEGLDIGAGVYPRSSDGSNGNNKIFDIGRITRWDDIKYHFGIAYTMPELFKINASFRTHNHSGIGSRESARAIGEFRLLAVENLTAILEVELNNLYLNPKDNPSDMDVFGETGQINIFETLAYKIEALQFGLNAAQYFDNRANKDLALRFNPWLSYALAEGKVVPRLDGVFFLGGDRSTGGDAGKYDRRTDLAATYIKDNYVWNVRPSVKFNFDSRTSLEIGDVFYYRNPAVGDAFINNVFYTDLVVRF
jgi:hypothetical protein